MAQKFSPPVRSSVTVPIPPNQAFPLFTEGFNAWWIGHHIGQADLAEAVLEPREVGRWYERDVDGSECDWGTVLTFQPPERLVVTWQINSHLQYDPDRPRASEVEVLFTEIDGHTQVDLEHRYIERHGEGADVVARYVSGEGVRGDRDPQPQRPAAGAAAARPQPHRRLPELRGGGHLRRRHVLLPHRVPAGRLGILRPEDRRRLPPVHRSPVHRSRGRRPARAPDRRPPAAADRLVRRGRRPVLAVPG